MLSLHLDRQVESQETGYSHCPVPRYFLTRNRTFVLLYF